MRIIRSQTGGQSRFGFLKNEIPFYFQENYSSLAELLRQPYAALQESAARATAGDPEEDQFLSPVTGPCQIVCQGKNYAEHILETGIRPEDKDYNLLFAKAASSLAPPSGSVIRPAHVRLLDYELELGLVIGREIRGPIDVTEENLSTYAAGIVMANDVSARDIQVPQGQWFKGKSYRTFCPVGPVLHLFSPGERLGSLEMELAVNGNIRQKTNTDQMIYRPHETLSEVSRLMDLDPGDLILTGTPGGVAMKVPSARKRSFFGLFFSEKKMMRLFIEGQSKSPKYLRDGDALESWIRSGDGRVDLGKQRLRIQTEQK